MKPDALLLKHRDDSSLKTQQKGRTQMTKLSPARAGWPKLPDLELDNRGKVRDTYWLGYNRLLVVATDGISIFDFVLNALVSHKGYILNAMNHFWLNYLAGFGFKTHFIAAGADIDQYLPEALRGNTELQSRAMVVQELKMAKWEFIFRNCLTGSGLASYKENGQVCGHKLPSGLQDGDELPYIIDTPTSKAEEGHDEHVSAISVRSAYPEATYQMLKIVKIALSCAKSHGIKLADTKFEIGQDGTLADEILTPDSSRFWDLREWQESRKPLEGRKAPASLDKQLVREWGKSVGIDKLDPKNPEDVEKVHAMVVKDNVLNQTTQTYRYIFWRLTGRTIEQYLRDVMKVQFPERPAKKVVVVCGSETDKPVVMDLISKINPRFAEIDLHIMSCHRNPSELVNFINNLRFVDVIIGVGSKALALPGVIDAWVHYLEKDIRVAGVALGEPGSKALSAAQLSIEEIPGTPVIMDEITGIVYTGEAGLCDVMSRVIHGELPPMKPRKEKPVQMNVWNNHEDFQEC